MKMPEIETRRLLQRPLRITDAPAVQRLAGEKEIASTTLAIPHPYEDGMAEEWIRTHKQEFERGESAIFAIDLLEQSLLMGAIGLVVRREHDNAELGYWIGKPFWGNGFCTEAAEAVVSYGFTSLGLNRIYASHFVRNPASGRVMENIGMRYEGYLRQHVKKWGVYEDLKMYAILRDEWSDRGPRRVEGGRESE